MLLLVCSAYAFDSEPVPVLLQDEAEFFTGAEYSTGLLPSGSPLAVEFAIVADGGGAVSMEGEGNLSWPDAMTLGFTGDPGSGIFLLDAELSAVTTVWVDLSEIGYTGSFEIDRRSIAFDGATFFDPFVLPGTEPLQVVDTSAGTELINYSYDIFGGVASLEFDADMEPTVTTNFQGVQWTVNDGVITQENAPATLTPERAPDYDVEAVYTGQWDASFDLVFTPALSVCAALVGCIEIASFEIPVTIAGDSFEQDFEPALYSFPLPLLEPGIETGDFGTLEPGQTMNLQVPLENVGHLSMYGDATIEGTGQFTVYPNQFNALPGTTDGVVVTFSPTVEGEQTATLVLTSNDPTLPLVEIPLVGNAAEPDPDEGDDVIGDEEKVTAEASTCGCESTSGTAPAWAGIAALALLARRRRTSQERRA